MKFSSKTIAITTLILLTSLILTAQDAVTPPPERAKPTALKSPGPPAIQLEIKSTVKVANLYAANLNRPVMCGPNGDLYANIFKILFDAPPGFGTAITIVGINREGKAYLNIAPDKITDVQGARLGSLFPAEDGLFLLIRDGDPEHSAAHQGDFETLFHKADSEHTFIARFDRDGAYRGSIGIDIPISALQLAMFPGGQFVILGLDDLNQRKIALLKPSGDFDRYIELPRKPAGGNPEIETQPDKGHLLSFGLDSRLIADGNHILLISPTSDSVFVISASGSVEEVRLNPGGSGVSTLQAVPEGWLIEFDSSGTSKQGVVKRIVIARLFARTDGHLIRNYVYTIHQDSVPGCFREGELTFLRSETDDSLLLLTAAPGEKGNANPPEKRPDIRR